MKNKRGFTLVELLAVIAIIALISLVAIPNIVGLSTGIRKDQMLDDAKKFISLAKYQVNKNYNIRINPPKTFKLSEVNTGDDIANDPDGGTYDQDKSFVTYTVENGIAKYCVYLEGEYRKICKMQTGCETADCCTLCIEESNLYSRSNVIDK